jgi:RNA ligase
MVLAHDERRATMIDLHALFHPDEITEAVDLGHLGMQTHPEFDLTIYNYTSLCQISRAWTPVTSACRGLIVGPDGKVLARPFPKFFNYGEIDVLPHFATSTPPVVTDKMDGSLGVIYKRPDGRYAVSTRGSFASDQALWASRWLAEEMPNFTQPEGVTTLVEIIYPENRIVVDYGDRAELVLLGAIDIATGADIHIGDISWWPGARTMQHLNLGDVHDVRDYALSDDKEEDEGVVAVWYRPGEPSFRLKVKHPEYVRLHRIITGINTKRIWEVLSDGGDFTDVIDRVPDEFYGWVKGTISDLRQQHRDIEDAAFEQFQIICLNTEDGDRKGFAEAAKKSPYPGLMFSLLDGKDIEPMIWKMVKPLAAKPFANEEA